MYTPENITELKPNEVFVFGSNWQGNHYWGAAKIALERFGAIQWQAEWLQGQSFAINTMDWLEYIANWLNLLREIATIYSNKIFYLTKIGCGIAWYEETLIIELVNQSELPSNVILPKWR